MYIDNIDKYVERQMINEKCGEPDCDPPWDFSYETPEPLPPVYVPWRTRTLAFRNYINSFKVIWMPEDTGTENEPTPAWINKRYYKQFTHSFGCSIHRCEESPLGKPIKRIGKEKKVMEKKCIMVTGHRPDKLPGGYNLESPANKLLEESLYRILRKAQPTSVITGMALGVDQIFLTAALRLRQTQELHIIAAVPCLGQERIWPIKAQGIYAAMLDKCDTVKILSKEYTRNCMCERNQWMVDKCTSAIAVYDGSAGGTQDAVNKLKTAKKNILVIHPQTGKLTPIVAKGAK